MFFKRRLFLLVVLVLLFILLLYLRENQSWGQHSPFSVVHRLLSSVYTPVHEGIDLIKDFFSDTWSGYLALVGVQAENKILKEELAKKKLLVISLKERLKFAEGKKDLQEEIELHGWQGVTCNVIAFDPFALSKTVWISCGANEGVRIDQPVMTLEGLAGRIVTVGPDSSQVLLLIDSRFAVDVIDEESRVRVLAVGLGDTVHLKRYPYLSQLEYLNLGAEIHPGDLLITSGLSPLYPAGIPVGNVIDVEKGEEEVFQRAAILPLVDFTKLEQVMVIK